MSRIERKTQKIFASGASNNGQFGSGQNGTKILSNDLDVIQALSAWAQGWLSAVLGASKFPPLEEFQSLMYVATTQLAYLFQEGLAEWDAGTNYSDTAIVKKTGTFELYGSLVEDNLGNALTDGASWKLLLDLATPNPAYYLGGISIGSANAQVVTPLTPSGYARVAGNVITFEAGFTNSAALLLNLGGTGLVATKKDAGGGALVDLVSGDVDAGSSYAWLDNGTYYILQETLDPSAFLQKTANLSDVADAPTSLANIGGAPLTAIRTRLAANTDYYVNWNLGNDSTGDGSVGNPWKTLQKAGTYIHDQIDIAGHAVIVHSASGGGTDTGGVDLGGPFVGGGSVTFLGDTTTPANCPVAVTSKNCFQAQLGCVFAVGGYKMTTVTGGSGLFANNGGKISAAGRNEYGACAGPHKVAAGAGAEILEQVQPYIISGGAPYHYYQYGGGGVNAFGGVVATLIGTPAFTIFAFAERLGLISAGGFTFTGAATGQRYNAQSNGVIDTGGVMSASFFPGNTAGSKVTGGQYI